MEGIREIQNIINYDRLDREASSWRDLNLCYRQGALERSDELSLGFGKLITVLTSGLALSVLSFLITTPILTWVILPSIFYGTGVLAVGLLITKRNWNVITYAFGALFLFLVVSVLFSVAPFSFPLRVLRVAVALGAAAVLAHAVVGHYAEWMLAHPLLSHEARAKRRALYRGRARMGAPSAEGDKAFRSEVRALKGLTRSGYASAFIAIGGISAAAALLRFDFLFFLPALILVVPPLYAVYALRVRAPWSGAAGFGAGLTATARAFVSWLTYQDGQFDAPGLYRSRYGTPTQRTALAVGVVWVVIGSLIPVFNASVPPSLEQPSFVAWLLGGTWGIESIQTIVLFAFPALGILFVLPAVLVVSFVDGL